jgi:hypothetical protein
VTYLSRLTALGLAKEVTQGTYLAPTDSIPFIKCVPDDMITQLRDETIRANDAVVQGIYQGPWLTAFDIETNAYPDIAGHWFRGIVGPDVVSAGISTTLSANTTIGATSITTAASIPLNSIIQIQDSGGTNLEYAKTGTPTGPGPYTIPITTPSGGLSFAHTSPTCTIVSQTTHTFTQNRTFSTVWPSYSMTVWDGVDNARGFPGLVMSDLQIKIDPKGICTFNPKYTGWPSAIQAPFVPTYTTVQPQRGWGWTMTNAGASSTRGLTYDVTLKRALDPIHSSDGVQGPREVFAGALEADGTYKAIFENTTDYNLYYNATQSPTSAVLTEPVGGGMNAGTSLTITMSKSGYTKYTPDLSQPYVQADFDIAGINNVTDAGIATVILKNFRSSSY